MRRLCLLLLLTWVAMEGTAWAKKSVVLEKQLREQRNALKTLEKDLESQRRQLKATENEEKGVLNTLSLLDQNLGQTKDYLRQLQRTETVLEVSVSNLRQEIDSISHDLERQQKAMRQRIRELYMQGRQNQWQQLWHLLRQRENPERSIYLVHRLLREDQNRVNHLRQSRQERQERQNELRGHLQELSHLHSRKRQEESKLQNQISRQEGALDGLRRDKEKQRRALVEFENNQKMMITLIQNLEKKRREQEARRKKNASQRGKQKKKSARDLKP
ncbi:MAG TPA: peptidase M23, partial [Fibrobacteraceae bacterium]|nr:peptidase M23 [Fibrobacteraceae bacterium]